MSLSSSSSSSSSLFLMLRVVGNASNLMMRMRSVNYRMLSSSSVGATATTTTTTTKQQDQEQPQKRFVVAIKPTHFKFQEQRQLISFDELSGNVVKYSNTSSTAKRVVDFLIRGPMEQKPKVLEELFQHYPEIKSRAVLQEVVTQFSETERVALVQKIFSSKEAILKSLNDLRSAFGVQQLVRTLPKSIRMDLVRSLYTPVEHTIVLSKKGIEKFKGMSPAFFAYELKVPSKFVINELLVDVDQETANSFLQSIISMPMENFIRVINGDRYASWISLLISNASEESVISFANKAFEKKKTKKEDLSFVGSKNGLYLLKQILTKTSNAEVMLKAFDEIYDNTSEIGLRSKECISLLRLISLYAPVDVVDQKVMKTLLSNDAKVVFALASDDKGNAAVRLAVKRASVAGILSAEGLKSSLVKLMTDPCGFYPCKDLIAREDVKDCIPVLESVLVPETFIMLSNNRISDALCESLVPHIPADRVSLIANALGSRKLRLGNMANKRIGCRIIQAIAKHSSPKDRDFLKESVLSPEVMARSQNSHVGKRLVLSAATQDFL